MTTWRRDDARKKKKKEESGNMVRPTCEYCENGVRMTGEHDVVKGRDGMEGRTGGLKIGLFGLTRSWR